MAALPDAGTLVESAGVGGCMGIPTEFDVFSKGFKPILTGMIEASLGPIGVILDALSLPLPPKVIADLTTLVTDLPQFMADLFNKKLGDLPSIDLGALGVPAPFNISLGGSGPDLDPTISAGFGMFLLDMLMIPFKVMSGVLEKLVTLDFSADIPGLIADSIPEVVPGFGPCVTKAVVLPFEILGAGMADAKEDRDKTVKEKAKEAETLHSQEKTAEAIKIIKKQIIKEDAYKKATGKEAFFKWKKVDGKETPVQIKTKTKK